MTREFLIFQLVAPMGSFGGLAVGERRGTASRPSHSALSGLLAAALGLDRADPRQRDFAAGLAFATRRDHLGPMLTDFHLAQAPPTRSGVGWRTRREELSGELSTILSRRDYHADCAFTVACLALESSLIGLPTIAEALLRPVFALYLGRKSCPLGLPPNPKLLASDTLQGAFAAYDECARPDPFTNWRAADAEIACDGNFLGLLGVASAHRKAPRRDAVVDRKCWRFDLRDEYVFPPSQTGEMAE